MCRYVYVSLLPFSVFFFFFLLLSSFFSFRHLLFLDLPFHPFLLLLPFCQIPLSLKIFIFFKVCLTKYNTFCMLYVLPFFLSVFLFSYSF